MLGEDRPNLSELIKLARSKCKIDREEYDRLMKINAEGNAAKHCQEPMPWMVVHSADKRKHSDAFLLFKDDLPLSVWTVPGITK